MATIVAGPVAEIAAWQQRQGRVHQAAASRAVARAVPTLTKGATDQNRSMRRPVRHRPQYSTHLARHIGQPLTQAMANPEHAARGDVHRVRESAAGTIEVTLTDEEGQSLTLDARAIRRIYAVVPTTDTFGSVSTTLDLLTSATEPAPSVATRGQPPFKVPGRSARGRPPEPGSATRTRNAGCYP